MSFLERLNKYLMLLGLPGLLIISLLDGAAVPIVGGPDALVLLLSWQRPAQIWLIVLAAVLGSTAGCLVLYNVGRIGGVLALSRFGTERQSWVKQKLDRNAFGAVMLAVVAPPPFPTKLVILAAGAFGIRMCRFSKAVLAGRLLRYGLLAWLGVRFGDQAAAVVREHFLLIALGFLSILGLAYLVRRYWIAARPTAEAHSGPDGRGSKG